MTDEATTEPEVIWRVSSVKDGGIDLYFGPTLSDMPIDDDDKLTVVGRALIQLGTRLMTATTSESDDEWDDDEDWEDEE